MVLWYILLAGLCLIGAADDTPEVLYPMEVYAPRISGISGVKLTNSDESFVLVFSGNTDVSSYSSNMMIKYDDAIQFSSTSDYPSDRSYYGMAYSTESFYDYELENAIVFGGIGPHGVIGDFWKYYSDFDFWEQLDTSLPESSYDFAYTSYYDSTQNLTHIFVAGGINNLNEYVNNIYEFVIEDDNIHQFNDYTECTENGLAGAQLIYSSDILYLFSGYSYSEDVSYFEDLCSLDVSDTGNSWTKISTNSKLDNYIHGGSCLYNDNIFYFFGSNYGVDGIIYNDKIYKLDLSDIAKGWKDVGFTCPEDIDCARDSFGYACNDNEVTIIGGKTVSGTTNSFFTIDLASLDFIDSIDAIIESTFPKPRAFASLTQSSTKLLLFGGLNKGEIFDDIWEFDYDSNTGSGIWTPFSASGSSPEARYGHAAATQGVFTVFIGGTADGDRILSDIWLLNLITNTWTEIIPSETSPYKIPALTRTCAMLDLPKLYFIGGQGYSGSNFDLWEYDLSTNNLTRLYKTKPTDIGTHGHACQLIKEGNSSLIYTLYGMTNKMNDLYCKIRMVDITEIDKITVKVTREKPEYMTCRGNFGFSYDGQSMVIAGGEIFPNFVMNDIVWVNFTGEYGELFTDPLFEPLSSGSAVLAFADDVLAFADYVFIFSGFHDGSFSIDSDLSSSLYLAGFTGNLYCGYGFIRDDGYCEPCGEGTYKPTYDGVCLEDLQAAMHISQCVPCPSGTFFNEESKKCESCPEGTLCPVGSSVALNSKAMKLEQQSQPKNFNQPSIELSILVLGSIFGFSILVFIIIFCSSLLFKVIFSVYDVYRGEHIIPRGEKSYEEDKTKISFVGGFFTGLAIIIINFNFALFIINYVHKNQNELRSFVPMISLVQDQDYSNNHLMLEIYMYSYRDDCSNIIELESSFFNTTYAYFDEVDVGDNITACNHVIDIDYFNTLFTTGSSIKIGLKEYTSDISVTLSGKSGNPGADSSYTQIVTPTDGFVFKGNDPTVFSFSLMPAYYSNKGLFGHLSEYVGFRVSSFVAPAMGSLSSRENIYLETGFNIEVMFIMSESGMTTYRFHSIDPISLVILMLSSVPGLIGLCASFLRSYERIYYLVKRVQVGFEGASFAEQYNKLKNQVNNNNLDPENQDFTERERRDRDKEIS
ncbi:hypothetical protein SteCoe_36799 [Stentor coeruleus]|uniref:Tyrosine-protein kinase ephrin type A/B receptor-like domain-containing protein n=1 Tax=Stentor coeruleus TaxID=5963 RepID=A0A1R2APP6_9CILI|nr:hypothetical protein SteCoe_36799 [Stentor coeruleus]